jgi:magnesium chelatase subunit D
MKPSPYPFTAIVGQEPMKLALELAAVDWRLGVLLRGDKGAGKTTAARGLAALLAEPAPFINLPIGVTEDRLLGGLHLESTLKGNPVLKPGLLSEAHGGVLYIDEVNLLPAHLGDALLDAAATGVNVVEREGFSASHAAEFVLLGSMNPEEGLLRPQLLDRFALAVDIVAPIEPEARQQIVERRIAFERESEKFSEEWRNEQATLQAKISKARECVDRIECPSEILALISSEICKAGVRSLRADLAAVRASIAAAALLGDTTVTAAHVETVLPLVLNHRARTGNRSQPPPPPPPPPSTGQAKPQMERIFAPQKVDVPPIRESFDKPTQPGPIIRSRQTETPQEIDIRSTLNHAVREKGTLQPGLADLHEKVREPRTSIRFIFLIDSSGSHAAQEKMRLVKGAVLGILTSSFRKNDEVVLIAFRGTDAQVLLEPSRQLDEAATALEYLPTGGRTPLAHAFERAKTYQTPSTFLILLSDGRANVAISGGDPWQEALIRASELNCRTLVIDTESPNNHLQRIPELAEALKAKTIPLLDLEHQNVLELAGRA